MNADEQVAVLLKFALTIGPIAIYFLALGLLNAQARPRLLTGQADFLLLAVVFFPILIWATLVLADWPWVALVALAFAAGIGFYCVVPRQRSSWVIYNVSQPRFERALGRALDRQGLSVRRLGPDPRCGDRVWQVPGLRLRIRISPFSLLRNVTCHFEQESAGSLDPRRLGQLRQSLQDKLETVTTLPSVSAACFILIGTMMLTAPLLMMAHHMDAIVKVVRSLFA